MSIPHTPMLRVLMLTLSVAVLPGCDKDAKPTADAKIESKTEAKSKSGDPAGTAPSCDEAYGKAVRKELTQGCSLAEQILSLDVPLAPWTAAASSPPSSYLRLDVSTEGVGVDGATPMPIASLDESFKRRVRQKGRVADNIGEDPGSWVLAVAADVPRADVAAVFQVLLDIKKPSGHVLLATTQVGEFPAPRKPEVLAALAAELDGADPSTRATILAKEIEAKMPPCPGVEAAFGAVAAAPPEHRCSLLAVGISEGLVACGCPDADVLLTQMHALTVGATPPERLSVAVPVTLDPSAPSREGETWAKVVEGAADEAAFASLWIAPR